MSTSRQHLLLAIADHPGKAGDALRNAGAGREPLRKALAELQAQRVTDQNPEDKFQALERFGRDLTEAAREGKLDPVIGRDDEIRRVIQVLSRRTKNNPVLIGEPGVGKTAIVEGWPSESSTVTCPRDCGIAGSWRLTWGRWSPAPSTGASLRTV